MNFDLPLWTRLEMYIAIPYMENIFSEQRSVCHSFDPFGRKLNDRINVPNIQQTIRNVAKFPFQVMQIGMCGSQKKIKTLNCTDIQKYIT